MRVTPGQAIPFWLKLEDGNPSRYVLAHVTSLAGVEQAGSPYHLSYSGNRGIYVGTGPIMGTSDLMLDFEVFLDAGFTQLDRGHLGSYQEIAADVSNIDVLNTLLGKISALDPNTVVGVIDQSYLQASIDSSSLIGVIDISPNIGTITNVTQDGIIDTGVIIDGELN